jgi:lambda family phage minor tail protein L
MTTIIQHSQGSALGDYIKLYHMDLTTKFGETDFFFIEGPEGGGTAHAVTFDGQLYSPFDCSATGFEVTGDGQLPRPTLTVSNASGIFTPLLIAYDDLKGATITRMRTFSKFLDDGSDPDPDARFADEVFIINKKTVDDGDMVQWELIAAIDVEGVIIPGRQITRDYCSHSTRVWTGSAFDLTDATCPWGASPGQEQAYDVDGVATTDAAEVFSKRLNSCCKARFGDTAELPYAGWPGVARVRAR